jgi:hypothetical protein
MIKLGGLVNLGGAPKFETGKVYSNPYVNAFAPIEEEEETIEEQDHEVNMAQGQLDYIIKSANELKAKLGEMEKDVPGWIQDHISKAHSYIHQANSGFHELHESINENIKNDVDKFVKKLNTQFDDNVYELVSSGSKYVRITQRSKKFSKPGEGSAWGFVALVDNPSKGIKVGDLLKAAGWNTPAKHARGNILDGTASYTRFSPTYLR